MLGARNFLAVVKFNILKSRIYPAEQNSTDFLVD